MGNTKRNRWRKVLRVVLSGLALTASAVEVRDVTARQRYPWNGLVDIACTVTGIYETTDVKFIVSAVMPDSGVTQEVSNFWVVQGRTNSTDWVVCTNGDYRIVWDAQADLGQVRYTNIVVCVTVKVRNKIQLWEGGPYWAETNIGAEEPHEYGYYFWWGNAVGYKRENNAWVASDGSSSNFSFAPGNTPTDNKSIAFLHNEGWITADSVLLPQHDAAHVHWGGNWRMPTKQEQVELNDKCDWTWTTQNGVNGYVVRGRGNYASASIFLPCAGYGYGTSLYDAGSRGLYWSSVPDSDGNFAYVLYFNSGYHSTGYGYRYYGRSVRPVQGFAE